MDRFEETTFGAEHQRDHVENKYDLKVESRMNSEETSRSEGLFGSIGEIYKKITLRPKTIKRPVKVTRIPDGALIRSPEKIYYKLNKRINRIIGFLCQLQEIIKPNRLKCVLIAIMFVLNAVANITSYYNWNISSLVLNNILLGVSIIIFVCELRDQIKFSLRFKEGKDEYIIVDNENGSYEIKVINTDEGPNDMSSSVYDIETGKT
jgi:hypothetical protein